MSSLQPLLEYIRQEKLAAGRLADRRPEPPTSPTAATDAQQRGYYRARANAMEDVLRKLKELVPEAVS